MITRLNRIPRAPKKPSTTAQHSSIQLTTIQMRMTSRCTFFFSFYFICIRSHTRMLCRKIFRPKNHMLKTGHKSADCDGQTPNVTMVSVDHRSWYHPLLRRRSRNRTHKRLYTDVWTDALNINIPPDTIKVVHVFVFLLCVYVFVCV